MKAIFKDITTMRALQANIKEHIALLDKDIDTCLTTKLKNFRKTIVNKVATAYCYSSLTLRLLSLFDILKQPYLPTNYVEPDDDILLSFLQENRLLLHLDVSGLIPQYLVELGEENVSNYFKETDNPAMNLVQRRRDLVKLQSRLTMLVQANVAEMILEDDEVQTLAKTFVVLPSLPKENTATSGAD